MAKVTLKDLFYGIHVKLGGTGVEVEIVEDDYMAAFDEAVRQYRSMAVKAVKYGFWFVELQPAQSTYPLPPEIDTVVEVMRMQAGYLPGSAQFEPFSAAFIQQTLGTANGGFPGLVNYELMMGYQEMLERMLGGHIMFEFNRATNDIMFWYTPKTTETVALHCTTLRTIDELIHDQLIYLWLQKYTEGRVRTILGEKYSKSTIPGPSGGIQLKGPALIESGKEMIAACIEDLRDVVDGGLGSTAPFIG